MQHIMVLPNVCSQHNILGDVVEFMDAGPWLVFLAQIELLNSFLVKFSGISRVGDSLDHWAEQDLPLASLRGSFGDVK